MLTKAELARLATLRARFLDGSNAGGGYWRSEEDLSLYDATLGERIGWKWDTVLAELRARGWQPRAKHVIDWGCGSGIAGRRVLGEWPGFESVTVADVSPLAMRFAEERARDAFPGVRTRMSLQEFPKAEALLLVSHVLNELDAAAHTRLMALARQAAAVIWVESGTHADSRALIAVREELRAEFRIVAPCTHEARCGMLTEQNARHWCHHFARVPAEASRDARWAQFGRELGIDMRALPCSFLVLDRRDESARLDEGCSRIIGRPREEKARMEILSCQAGGIEELMLQKRDEPALFKQLQKGRADALYRWQRDGRRIVAAEPLCDDDRTRGGTGDLPHDDGTG
ncbi:MAG: small ribosomal subunit Rsm22 family protein [Chthoniobacteraceae bacterium]